MATASVVPNMIYPQDSAGTSAITEFSYHQHKHIEASVVFITCEEWRAELTVLLGSLVDGRLGVGAGDDQAKEDINIAWNKVRSCEC